MVERDREDYLTEGHKQLNNESFMLMLSILMIRHCLILLRKVTTFLNV